MQLEARKYLEDIKQAIEELNEFVSGRTYANYESDALLRAGVERKFLVIGEALSQLLRQAPNTAEGVTDYRRIIAFRNILIHGYSEVDDLIVWDIIASKLPTLQREIRELLNE
jgi:uncharacterized protein with HEPN domain